MLKVIVIGRLGNDAEIKDFNGKKYISFNVAATETYKDGSGNKVNKTTWISCLKYGESAVLNYLKKGTQVYLRGDLSAKTYTNQNGVQIGFNCRVSELELLGSRQDAQQNQQPGAASQAYGAGSYGSGYGTTPDGYPAFGPGQDEAPY